MDKIENDYQYLEPGYEPPGAFMPDDAYSLMLDSVVLTCVDIVLTCNGRMLLGQRAWHPQADWWLIGGRMKAGETFEATAARNLARETGLKLDRPQFSYLTMFSAAWKLRRHAPAENGTHTVSVVMHAELDADLARGIILNEEYVTSRWSPIADVATDETLHPALRQCAEALLRRS